ncbi:hypothetical protein LCGC14_2337710, partial [marine sediment metagenome]
MVDQQFKVDALIDGLPDLRWIRTDVAPSALGWDVGLAVDAFINLPRSQGLKVAVGLYGNQADIKDGNDKWRQWCRDVLGRVEPTWVVADMETADAKFFGGGWQGFIDLWGPLIPELQAMGHKVMGPGTVRGVNTPGPEHFDRILGAIPFDAPSAHFYTARGRKDHLAWMKLAEEIAVKHGHTWGAVGETGEHGE